MDDASGRALPPLPRLLVAAGLSLGVLLVIPGLSNPFVVPKESLVALLAAFVVLVAVSDRRARIGPWPPWATVALVLPLAAISVASAAHALDMTSADGPLRWWTYALFVVALRLACDGRACDRLIALLALLGGVEGGLVIAQVLAGDWIFDYSALPSAKWRAFGTLGNPNWVGGFLAATAPLALAELDPSTATGAARRRAYLVAGAILSGLVLTLSRGAWLAAGAGVVVLAALRPQLPWRRLAMTAAAAAVLAGSIAWLRFGADEIGAAVARRESIDGRARMWAISTAMIAAHPFTGFGPGRFPVSFPPFQRQYLSVRGDATVTDLTDHPHNEYLHLATEAGLPALLALLSVIGVAVWQAAAQRAHPSMAGAAGALAALALHAGVDTTLRMPATAAVFCVLLVAVFVHVAEAAGAGWRRVSSVERAAVAVLAVLAILHATRMLVTDRALAGAQRALANGDAARARQLAGEALQLDASQAQLWAVLALASRQTGDDVDALAAATRARALRPAPELVYLIAALERERGRPERAIAELREWSETVPGLLLPHVLLGEALAADGQVEAAREELSAVLTMHSKRPTAAEQVLHQRAAERLESLPKDDG